VHEQVLCEVRIWCKDHLNEGGGGRFRAETGKQKQQMLDRWPGEQGSCRNAQVTWNKNGVNV
jgi:hypothetical protein